MPSHHEVVIESLAHGGAGVARIDNQVCFVDDALPGDRLRVNVTPSGKRFLRGQIVEVLEPGPGRVDAPCAVFNACGGCSWLHFAYPAQGEWKQRIVRECFERIGRMDVEVAWAEEPALRLGYRTRATFQADGDRRGFYARDSHRVVDIASCPLCHPRLNEAFARLRGSGVPGPVELTVNPEGDEVLAWSETNPHALRELFPDASGPEDEERSGFMFDGVPIVAGAFSQASLLLNRMLVRIAHEAIGGAESLLDLYCGSGNFSMGLPDRTRVTGFDHDAHAIGAAMAQGRGRYLLAGERSFRKQLDKEPWGVVLVDPPRRGAKDILPWLAKATTGRIVYVSCDPATLARDAAALVAKGWRVESVVAVDMYPNTPHIEAVCVFGKA
jgi:23S rRNA (uracil1939-C5)-methyltransferase